MTKKEKIKSIIAIIFTLFLMFGGLAGILYAVIKQMILCYQKFGVIISKHLIILDWSLLGYLGIIPCSISLIILEIYWR